VVFNTAAFRPVDAGTSSGDAAAKAKQCFEDAAAAGDVSAAYWLGVATLNGDGVVGIRCDPRRGIALITQAAGWIVMLHHCCDGEGA
jgi:hypothetical protein